MIKMRFVLLLLVPMRVLLLVSVAGASLIHSVNDHVLHQKVAIATNILSSTSSQHLSRQIDSEVVSYFGKLFNLIKEDGSRGDLPVEQGVRIRRALLHVLPELIKIQGDEARELTLIEISRAFILDSEKDDVRRLVSKELHINKRLRSIPEGFTTIFEFIRQRCEDEVNARAPLGEQLGDAADFYSLESKRRRMLYLIGTVIREQVKEKLDEVKRDLSLEELIASFDEDSGDDL